MIELYLHSTAVTDILGCIIDILSCTYF